LQLQCCIFLDALHLCMFGQVVLRYLYFQFSTICGSYTEIYKAKNSSRWKTACRKSNVLSLSL